MSSIVDRSPFPFLPLTQSSLQSLETFKQRLGPGVRARSEGVWRFQSELEAVQKTGSGKLWNKKLNRLTDHGYGVEKERSCGLGHGCKSWKQLMRTPHWFWPGAFCIHWPTPSIPGRPVYKSGLTPSQGCQEESLELREPSRRDSPSPLGLSPLLGTGPPFRLPFLKTCQSGASSKTDSSVLSQFDFQERVFCLDWILCLNNLEKDRKYQNHLLY